MKIVMIKPQTSKSPNHFFIWGDEMTNLYNDDSVTHVGQQFDDIIRVVSIDSLLKAPSYVKASKTMNTYFQWTLSDISFVIVR